MSTGFFHFFDSYVLSLLFDALRQPMAYENDTIIMERPAPLFFNSLLQEAVPMPKRPLHILYTIVIAAVFGSAVAASAADTVSDSADAATKQTAAIANDNKLVHILSDAKARAPGAVAKFCDWLLAEGLSLEDMNADAEAQQVPKDLQALYEQLQQFAGMALEAEQYAAEALANPEYDKNRFHLLVMKALAEDSDAHTFAVETVELVSRAWRQADGLVKTRDSLLARFHDEARRGGVNPGTRLAWNLIRVGAADPETRIDAATFRFDENSAEMSLRHHDADFHIRLDKDDYRHRVRASTSGYSFRTGWPVLLQKPLGWMAHMARDMRLAGVKPGRFDEWELMEAPEGLVALTLADSAAETPAQAFYRGKLRDIEAIPAPADAATLKEDFLEAAKALHEGILGDESISRQLRQALAPVLKGTYQEIDSRDYFDNDFCRRLVEADYLEAHIRPFPEARARELQRYRETLAKIDAGIDRFAIDLGGEGRMVAITRPDIDVRAGNAEDIRDPETGETVSRYQWRWEKPDMTVFHSPLPGRYIYAMSVLEYYGGRHKARPIGVPAKTEVWHALLGRLAEYADDMAEAIGDADKWQEAVVMDARGRRDPNAGPLGWNFPMYVPVRDDQGDPFLIATARGVVPSPDFSSIADESARRKAQDDWLDHTADVLATPGEMNLIYQVFFRYCSDSPLPELPNLIGSHYGLSDTHQTVYQSLERRWVGRLIGDCDDLAEFFQNLAVRQGRLAQVMQLPAHAAAGWLEENSEGGYEFIVLQTGPVLRFTGESREEAVEKAYRHFDDQEGGSHFTITAVPLLLRFADEDTRTPFVLSARIYWDRDYAEDMIKVQGYWHLHTFSAAVKTMEEMLESDREAGNVKELASLYEQIGEYEKASRLREEEFKLTGDDALGALSTLLDMAQLQIRAKNKPAAMHALRQMQTRLDKLRQTDSRLYGRALSFRSSWAVLLARLGEPEQAWSLVRHDVEEAMSQGGAMPEPLLRTLVAMYDRLALQRDSGVFSPTRRSTRIRFAVRNALSRAFGEGYFKKDDSYNKIHTRYFWLGRYGVAVAGRKAGLDALFLDGPYPDGSRDHAARNEDLTEQDWEWFRIMPRLYLAYGLEMLDREEYPELYDPISAKRSLELVARAAEKGSDNATGGLVGQDAVLQSRLALSFVNRDLEQFCGLMEEVRSKDYSSLYDDAAVMFGTYCGQVPVAEFAPWIEAFHTFFPGKQNYFKAAYRALAKGHFDHAVMLARATAGFFPDEPLLVDEAAALEQAADRLQRLWLEKGWDNRDWASRREDDDIVVLRSDLVVL